MTSKCFICELAKLAKLAAGHLFTAKFFALKMVKVGVRNVR